MKKRKSAGTEPGIARPTTSTLFNAVPRLCVTISLIKVYLTAQGYFVVISNGFFAQRSLALDSALVIVTAFAVHVNVLWIPVQFAYRYTLLCLQGERLGDREEIINIAYHSRRHAVNRAIATFAIIWNVVAFAVIYAVLKPQPEFQEMRLKMLRMNRWPMPNGTTAENSAVFGAHLVS